MVVFSRSHHGIFLLMGPALPPGQGSQSRGTFSAQSVTRAPLSLGPWPPALVPGRRGPGRRQRLHRVPSRTPRASGRPRAFLRGAATLLFDSPAGLREGACRGGPEVNSLSGGWRGGGYPGEKQWLGFPESQSGLVGGRRQSHLTDSEIWTQRGNVLTLTGPDPFSVSRLKWQMLCLQVKTAVTSCQTEDKAERPRVPSTCLPVKRCKVRRYCMYMVPAKKKQVVMGLWSAYCERREGKITANLGGRVGTRSRRSDVPSQCGRLSLQSPGWGAAVRIGGRALLTQSSARGSPPGLRPLQEMSLRCSLGELGFLGEGRDASGDPDPCEQALRPPERRVEGAHSPLQ